MGWPIILAISVPASITLIVFLTSYICYFITFRTIKKEKDNPHSKVTLETYESFRHITEPLIDDLIKTPCEHVTVQSHDGLSLHARYYKNFDDAPLEIQMHGYRGHALRDFCSGGRDARERGNNLLLIDQRAHGRSEGSSISFGILERHDCLTWINLAHEKLGAETVILIGMSMGAATVLMASGMELPSCVKCVIADCPYTSPREIIRKVIGCDMHLPVGLLYPFVRLGGRIYGGFDIEEASPIEAVKNTKIPTLIIHGGADSFVPAEMSKRIFENCDAQIKHRLVIPSADHGLSYLVDKETYLTAVSELLNEASAK